MSYLLILSGIAFLCGFMARPIQGGQILGGMNNYRVIVTLLYALPLLPIIVLSLINIGITTWYGLPVPYLDMIDPLYAIIGLSILLCGLLLRGHYGPNHGDQMDMGTNGGTVEGDFKGMVVRFAGPLLIGAVVVVGFTSPEGALFKALGLVSWIVAAFVPAVTYRWAWAIGHIDVAKVSFLKPFRSYFPDHLGPTEVAERLYAGLYQGLVALGFVLLTLS